MRLLLPDDRYFLLIEVFRLLILQSSVFPGIFRGALAVRASAITEEMKVAAVHAIAGLIPEDELREDFVVPGAFDRRIVPAIAGAVAKVAMSAGIARLKREVQDIEKEAAERVLHNWNA